MTKCAPWVKVPHPLVGESAPRHFFNRQQRANVYILRKRISVSMPKITSFRSD